MIDSSTLANFQTIKDLHNVLSFGHPQTSIPEAVVKDLCTLCRWDMGDIFLLDNWNNFQLDIMLHPLVMLCSRNQLDREYMIWTRRCCYNQMHMPVGMA